MKKGTVTSLSTMFPAEEAQKAAKLLHDQIADKQNELNTLKSFISDNTNLVNLVQRLPDELHHDIMVPFGKAAFFPGRLIHTNEFMVLLGEGYFAERTSKQTIEILKRRGKTLESQVDSLKANMEDLKAEASFFDATASEAAEGLVEIREDYAEDDTSESDTADQKSSANAVTKNKNITLEDEEYARLMSRMDELEKQELAAENNKDKDRGEKDETSAVQASSENSRDQSLRNREEYHLGSKPHVLKSECATAMENIEEKLKQNFSDHLNLEDSMIKSFPKDENSSHKKLPPRKENTNYSDKTSKRPEVSQVAQVLLPASSEVFSSVERSQAVQSTPRGQYTSEVSERPSEPRFDSSKAFTGSIVEHADNLQPRREERGKWQSSESRPSKPVSRFKTERR